MKKSQDKRKPIVFVAMSGGVDSSVAALLLKRDGYDVTGVFMRCYNLDGCAERDASDARSVAGEIGIPFYVWDFENDYKKEVVNYMIDGYRRGVTPNPDVMCNKQIKFGLFLKKAVEMGADCIATGHYVRRLLPSETSPKKKTPVPIIGLGVAEDTNKDQSYFLWTLKQEQLRRCLFPIGSYLKSEVREMARGAGLSVADKKDSQGICFLGKISLGDFLRQYLPERRGAVLNLRGEKIGEHRGAEFYTIGQRQGIGEIKHQKGVHEHVPLYVAEKDPGLNTVTVAEGSDNPVLRRTDVELEDVNFLSPIAERQAQLAVYARVRYRQPLAPARLVSKNGQHNLIFENPVKFVATGQSAVFYSKKGELLGGGVISAAA